MASSPVAGPSAAYHLVPEGLVSYGKRDDLAAPELRGCGQHHRLNRSRLNLGVGTARNAFSVMISVLVVAVKVSDRKEKRFVVMTGPHLVAQIEC